MTKRFRLPCWFSVMIYISVLASSPLRAAVEQSAIRVAIVGLVHGHVKGFLGALAKNESARLVAIVEPEVSLAQKYASEYHLDSRLFYTDTERMIAEQHPDAILVYTTIADHR
jgi:predicted dehydrogenase